MRNLAIVSVMLLIAIHPTSGFSQSSTLVPALNGLGATKATGKGPDSSVQPATADSKPTSQPIVRSTVEVKGNNLENVEEHSTADSFHAASAEIQSSAGTYGDFSRYLQLFPGVVFNSDESDDVLVRGGNPIENLYMLDGIEVPNINHIATGATTGGLVSMIDTAAISGLDFQTGGYDASYEERLSSIINIQSREPVGQLPVMEGDVGVVGVGFVRDTPLPNNGSLLFSAHRSLLSLFTDDIGLNGVPIYTNSLIHAKRDITATDTISVDSLFGIDSIDITPQKLDDDETNTIDTQYRGWRMTNGVRWRHVYSAKAFGSATLSDSEEEQNIQQQDQLFDGRIPKGYTVETEPVTLVYSELTHDGMTNVRYDAYLSLNKNLTLILGSSLHLHRIAYNVAQPKGEQSPLSVNPQRSDAASFAPHFWTGESGSYGQGTYALHRWTLSAGGRVETFALGGSATVTPRFSVAYSLSKHTAVHGSVGSYNQQPPFLDMLSFTQNRFLKPIRAKHIIAGMELYKGSRGNIKIEAYQKNYANYPVSTEYPTLSLANMVDTLGQEFIWIPMSSAGTGSTRGAEVFGQLNIGSDLFVQANAAYARSEFSGLDGVMRRGNFDYPLVLNAAGRYRFARRYEVTGRYEYTSGRPYTPFQLEESAAQNRPVYDLTLVNALRGPFYSRLDFQMDRSFAFGHRRLVLYGGLENALDRGNLLGYAWMPRAKVFGGCKSVPTRCVSSQDQMGRFPNIGAKFSF
jgi:hypothetical protein